MPVFVDDMFRLHDGFRASPAARGEVARRLAECAKCEARDGLRCVDEPARPRMLSVLASRREGGCPRDAWSTLGTSTIATTPAQSSPQGLRVVWARADLAQGGVSHYTANLIEALDHAPAIVPHAVLIANAFMWDADCATRISRRCPIYLLAEGPYPTDVPHATLISRAQYREILGQADVVSTALHNDLSPAPVSDWAGKPLIWEAHGDCEWTRRAYHHVRDRTTRVMAVSPACVDALRTDWRQPVDVVEAAIDVRRSLPAADREQARKRLWSHERLQRWETVAGATWITYWGRLVNEKRLDRICDMVDEFGHRYGPVVGCFAGDGWQAAETRQMLRARLGTRCVLAPWQAELHDLTAAADVFAMTSDNEGGPLTLLEAIAGGLPVVGTAVALLPAIARTLDSVKAIAPWEPHVAADAVADLVSQSPQSRASSAWRAHQYIARRFGPERLAREFRDCVYAAAK